MQQVISPKITGNLLEAALKAWWSGVSIIPIGAAKVPAWHFMPLVWDDTKKKEVPSWKPYQENRATLKEVEAWFSPEGLKHGVTGVAAIGGKISGNLLMFDFDRGDEAFDLWFSCVQREIKGARVERTGEGWRVYVRLAAELSIRNAKLAEYVKPDGKNGCIIELKGEGGYALFAPSQYPRLTPSKFGRTNDSYELIEGGWDLPVIDGKTLDYLIMTAQEFDEIKENDPRPKEARAELPVMMDLGGIPNSVVEAAGREINGFLKKCENSEWGTDFLSWGRMAAWATAIEAGLGNPGFIWDAFAAGSKRHPAYDSKHDDARLDDLKNFAPRFNVGWFSYNLVYNHSYKQCLPKDQKYVLQGDVWRYQNTSENTSERLPEDFRKPGELFFKNPNTSTENPNTSGEVLRAVEVLQPLKKDVVVPEWLDALDRGIIPEVQNLAENIPIPIGGYGVVFGQPESGKSAWSVMTAWELATVHNIKVAYLIGEGLYGYRNRLDAIAEYSGAPLERGQMMLRTDAFDLINQNLTDNLIRSLQEFGSKVVFIDTLSMFFDGDENSSKDMARLNRSCKRIIDYTGATVIVVHHTTKDGLTERGSGALRGAAGTMIEITKDKATGIMRVACSKQKDGLHFASYYLQFKPVGKSFVLEPATPMLSTMSKIVGEPEMELLSFVSSRLFAYEGAKLAEIIKNFEGKYSTQELYKMTPKLLHEKLIVERRPKSKDPYKVTVKGAQCLRDRARENGNDEEAGRLADLIDQLIREEREKYPSGSAEDAF